MISQRGSGAAPAPRKIANAGPVGLLGYSRAYFGMLSADCSLLHLLSRVLNWEWVERQL